MMTVCHIGNDSLTEAMCALLLFVLFEWKAHPHSMRRALALGIVLGLTLLTKVYFLVLVPPLLVLAAMQSKRLRVYSQVLAIFGAATVVSAWWYVRNWIVTHSVSGSPFEV